MSKPNKTVSVNRLIEKHIGTAYDKVRDVANHLGLIEDTAEAMKAYLTFTSMYYGVLTEVPSVRPDGSSMEEGDMYYNEASNTLYLLSDAAWIAMGAVHSTTEVVTVNSGHKSGITTTIPLETSYLPKSGAVVVYVDGVYQNSIEDVADGDYNELDENTISFPITLLSTGAKVTVTSTNIVNTINPNISTVKAQFTSDIEGMTVVTLPDSMTYLQTGGNLEVHAEGKLQYVGTDYTESSNTQVTFLTPLTLGTKLHFKKGTLLDNVTLNEALMTTLATNIATTVATDIGNASSAQEAIDRNAAIALEAVDTAANLAEEAALRTTALGAAADARALIISDTTTEIANSISSEINNRNAAILIETDARIQALIDEATARGVDISEVNVSIDALSDVLGNETTGLTATYEKVTAVETYVDALGSNGDTTLTSLATTIEGLDSEIHDGSTGLSATYDRTNVTKARLDDVDDDNLNYTYETLANDHRSMKADVEHAGTGLSAVNSKTDAVFSRIESVDSAGKSIEALSGEVETLSTSINDGTTGITALNTKIDAAESTLNNVYGPASGVDIETMATSFQTLEASVNHVSTGLGATNTLADAANSSANTAIATLASVDGAGKTIGALAQDVEDIEVTISSGGAGDLTALVQRVTDVEGEVDDVYGDNTDVHLSTLASDHLSMKTAVNHSTTGLAAAHQKSTDISTDLNTLGGANNLSVQSLATDFESLESAVNDGATGLAATKEESSTAITRLDYVDGELNPAKTVESFYGEFTTMKAAIDDDTTGLSATYDDSVTLKARIDSIPGYGSDIETLASAYSTLQTTVDHGTTGLAASFINTTNLTGNITTRLNTLGESETVAIESIATSFESLENVVNHGTTGLAASFINTATLTGDITSRLDTLGVAETTDIESIATSFESLENVVNDGTNGLAAAHNKATDLTGLITTRLDTLGVSETVAIESIATDFETLESTVNNGSTGLAASYTHATTLSNDLNTAITDRLDTLGATQLVTIENVADNLETLESTVSHGSTGLAASYTHATNLTTNLDNTITDRLDTLGVSETTNIESVATNVETLESTINHGTTGLAASFTNAATLTTNLDNSITDRLDDITGYGSSLEALGTAYSSLQVSVDDGTTGLVAAHNKATDLTTSITGRLNTLGTLSDTSIEAISTTTETNTLSITNNYNTLDGRITSEKTLLLNDIGDLEGQFSIKVDANNNIAGFGLSSTSSTYNGGIGHTKAEFAVDNLIIKSSTGTDTHLTFSTVGNIVKMDAVHIDNLSVTSADIVNLDVSKIAGDIANFFSVHANSITISNNTAISSAQTTATTGVNNAASAQTTANTAVTNAGIAQTTAEASANTANWSGVVDDDSNKPDDNATIGAIWGSNITSQPSDEQLLNNRLENSILTISRPIGATYSGPSNASGAIVITLPQGWTSTMMRMILDVYIYSGTYGSFSLGIGGYNYSTTTQWINTFAQMTGNTNSDNRVRFGINPSGKCCIVIGETTSNWPYIKAGVRDFNAGFSNFTEAQWDDGWDLGLATSLTGYVLPEQTDYSNTLLDAKAIINQGALATTSSADWDTQVTGATKPDDNATSGATWSTDINGQPSDTALLNVNTTPADIGYTGDLDANNTTNTNQLTDGANLGDTANWSGMTNDNGNMPANNADVTTDQLGGSGINIMAPLYSTFDTSELPLIYGWGYDSLTLSTDGHFSSNSLSIATTSTTSLYFKPTSTADYNIKFTEGKVWRVSFWCKTSTNITGLKVILRQGGTTKTWGPSTLVPTATDTWVRYSGDVDMTSGTISTIVEGHMFLNVFTNGGAGTALVDGIMIEEVIGTLTTPSTYALPGNPGDVLWGGIATLPDRFTDVPSTGLNLTPDYMGYYDGTSFKTYMNNTGDFYLSGDGTGSLTWDGTTLTVDGDVTANALEATTVDIVSTLHVQDNAITVPYNVLSAGTHALTHTGWDTVQTLVVSEDAGINFTLNAQFQFQFAYASSSVKKNPVLMYQILHNGSEIKTGSASMRPKYTNDADTIDFFSSFRGTFSANTLFTSTSGTDTFLLKVKTSDGGTTDWQTGFSDSGDAAISSRVLTATGYKK